MLNARGVPDVGRKRPFEGWCDPRNVPRIPRLGRRNRGAGGSQRAAAESCRSREALGLS